MAIKYQLSWRAGERRWRKRYKGRDYYFAGSDGKLASYQRCLREWRRLKAKIDLEDAGGRKQAARASWQPLAQYVRHVQQQLIDEYGDTEATREIWTSLEKIYLKGLIAPASDAGEVMGEPIELDDGVVELGFDQDQWKEAVNEDASMLRRLHMSMAVLD